jgi:hypothetical protein
MNEEIRFVALSTSDGRGWHLLGHVSTLHTVLLNLCSTFSQGHNAIEGYIQVGQRSERSRPRKQGFTKCFCGHRSRRVSSLPAFCAGLGSQKETRGTRSDWHKVSIGKFQRIGCFQLIYIY